MVCTDLNELKAENEALNAECKRLQELAKSTVAMHYDDVQNKVSKARQELSEIYIIEKAKLEV